MKTIHSFVASAFLLGATLSTATAGIAVSVDFFHDNLADYGDWREVGEYGYVWQPRDTDRNWRPYRDGRWLFTDAGWTWDSDEPYSWAVYHYGRWARVNEIGWVWVPGTEWGPAWVSWRRSPQHVGWAPLPPEARFNHADGFSSRVDADYDIGPGNYNFVGVRDFGSRRLGRVIVNPRENITIINKTTNITRISYTNNVVYNEGPRYDVISRESVQPIRQLKLVRREDFDAESRKARSQQLRTAVDGESYRVAAPVFDASPGLMPKKVAKKVEKPEVNRGWANAGPAADVEKLRTKIKEERDRPAPELPPIAEKPKVREEPVAKPEKPAKAAKPVVIPKPAKIAKPDAERTEPKVEVPTSRPAKAPTETRPPQKVQPGRGEARPKNLPSAEKKKVAPAPARKVTPATPKKVQPAPAKKQEPPPKRKVERIVPKPIEERPPAAKPVPASNSKGKKKPEKKAGESSEAPE